MVKIRNHGIAVLLILISLLACEEIKTDKASLPPSTGKYGEVLVVIDTTYENRKAGELVREIFYKAMVGLPQQEALFRMSTVSPKNFKSILKRSRNILKLSIGKGKKTDVVIEEDVWAKDQLLLQITANSDESASKILKKNIETIRAYFNEKEVQRLQKQYKRKPQVELEKEVEQRFDLKLSIPPGFVKMETTEQSIWFKKEKTLGEHQVLQGICIYTYPYESDSTFTTQEMVLKRNAFTASNITGTRDSSYMRVYEEYQAETQKINLNDRYTVEYRGLWNMKNDFMGGPFLHYTFVDEANNRVINLDGFVYAPKFNKREYLRELEAIMKSVNLSNK